MHEDDGEDDDILAGLIAGREDFEEDKPSVAGSRAKYNRAYYEKNKARLQARKNARYYNDPGYREAALKRRAAQRDREKKARARKKTVPKAQRDGIRMKLEFPNGDERVSVMYSIGQAAYRIGISVQTIRKWERENVLPEVMYKTTGGHRLYTADQVRVTHDTYQRHLARVGRWTLTDEFVQDLHTAWNRLYFGVTPPEDEE